MLIFATPLTYERLHIKEHSPVVEEMDYFYSYQDHLKAIKKFEYWSEIFEWYAELFYFNRKRCLRVVHLASSFTLYYYDVDERFMYSLGLQIKIDLLKYFTYDPEMQGYINKLFTDSHINFYMRISDKKRINYYHLNESKFDKNNELFSRYITNNGDLDAIMLNKAINTEFQFSHPGKTKIETHSSSDKLTTLLTKVYKGKNHGEHGFTITQLYEMSPHEIELYSK